LRQRIFKRKKGFAKLSLGLIYHSKALPQPPSRDTVPLTNLLQFRQRNAIIMQSICNFHNNIYIYSIYEFATIMHTFPPVNSSGLKTNIQSSLSWSYDASIYGSYCDGHIVAELKSYFITIIAFGSVLHQKVFIKFFTSWKFDFALGI
jgi:hypothetical protein